jgi:hypothetical protein
MVFPPGRRKARFIGNYEDLKDCFCEAGQTGVWTCREDQYRFDSDTGAVVSWWPRTHTILFQGRPCAAKRAEAAFIEVATIRYRPRGCR